MDDRKKFFAKDKDLRYTWCNEHFAHDLSIRPQDIVGKNDFDIFPTAIARKYRRDDRLVLRTGKTKDMEEKYDLNKEEHWVHTIKTPIHDAHGHIIGIQGVFWDTTERTLLEQRAAENKERLQKIANAIPDPVFVKDAHHRWIFVNNAFCRLIGHKRAELIGKSDYDFFPKNEAAVFWKKDTNVMKTGKENMNEEWFTDQKGSQHFISTKKRIIRLKDHTKILIGIIRDITNRRETEEALKASQMKFSTLYNASSDAIMILNPKGKFIGGNPTTLALFGCTSEREFLRCSFASLSPRYQSNGTESRVLAAKMIQKVMKGGSHSFEWIHQRKNKETFPASVLFTRMRIDEEDIIQATVRDLSKEKQSEQMLIASQKRLESEAQRSLQFKKALDSSRIGTIITTPDAKILYANPAWSALTGYTLDEARNKNPSILESGKTPLAVYERMWKAISQGKPFYADSIINKRKDGTLYNSELRVYPVMSGNHVQYLVGMDVDITQRIRGDEAKTAFMSLASHQLRTPLTAIRWGLNLFKKFGSLNKRQEEIFHELHAATARMAETINVMLKLSRIESGELPVKSIDIELSSLFQELKEALEPLTIAHKNTMQFTCAQHIHITTDRLILKEILSNLLSNAIKYTPSGGTIHMESNIIGGMIRISVSDTGKGIPKKEQANVFSKFFRGTNIVNNIPDGTGLGLYLVYALTQLLGGFITFNSKENIGSTFTLSLPLHYHGKKNSHR